MSLRGLVRSLLPAFIERGWGANQTLRLLRDVGLGYRRQDFLADFRAAKGERERSNLRNLNFDARPNVQRLPERYMGAPDRYSFIFRLDLVSYTGERERQYFTLHTDSVRTRQDYEDDALNYALSAYIPEAYMDINIMLIAGYRNPVYG